MRHKKTEPQVMVAPDGWLNAAQAADVLGVNRRTIQRWCIAGRFPNARQERVGGSTGYRWLIPRRDVEALRAG